MATKLILTNTAQLRTKYGEEGYAAIAAAVKGLALADAKRDIQSKLVAMDTDVDLAELGLSAVSDAMSAEQVKGLVDQLNEKVRPDYIMLLGADDVIPFVMLDNPVFGQNGDGDKQIRSDLPYACDAPYSTQVEDWTGPSRVVGRLPGVQGDKDAAYLVGLLKTATAWSARQSEDYENHLGLTAAIWEKQTRISLRESIGRDTGLEASPPSGPQWASELWEEPLHYINCHGGAGLPDFKGEGEDGSHPIAHEASLVAANARPGTVVVAECCYGAQLYPVIGSQSPSMVNAYLGRGGFGFVGSTSIAFGSNSGKAFADLMCQRVARHMLDGASMGRALLEARQDYVKERTKNGVIGPFDLKTLCQFLLMGDPSIHPVHLTEPGARPTGHEHIDDVHARQVAPGRADRRERLKGTAGSIGLGGLRMAVQNVIDLAAQAGTPPPPPPPGHPAALIEQLKAQGLIPGHSSTHVATPPPRPPVPGAPPPGAPSPEEALKAAFHVVLANHPDGSIHKQMGYQALEVNGEIVSIDELHRR